MGAQALDRSSAMPLWSQLQDDLRSRIRHGEFDAVFPGELVLAAEYSVSRATVRQALGQLRADGVVTAERGRPPQIARADAAAAIEQPLGTVSTLFDAVENTGRVQASVVRALERTADGVVATRLGLEESTPLLYLERLRYADDEPLAWDRVWLPFGRAAPLIGVDLTHTALYDELAGRTDLRVDSGRERIRADRAVPTEARLLGIAAGDPVLRMDRTGSCHDEPVEWRLTVARADRFTLNATFGPGDGYRLGHSTADTAHAAAPWARDPDSVAPSG